MRLANPSAARNCRETLPVIRIVERNAVLHRSDMVGGVRTARLSDLAPPKLPMRLPEPRLPRIAKSMV